MEKVKLLTQLCTFRATAGDQKTALDHIYAHVPEAVVHQLNESVEYVKEPHLPEDDPNEPKFCDELVELDFK